MTIFERKPKVATTAQVPESGRHALFKLAHKPVVALAEKYVKVLADPASARRMSKVIASVQSRSAKIVGLTGPRSGIGVSVVSRELAGAFASFGIKTLLVDVSSVNVAPSLEPEVATSLLPLAKEKSPLLSIVEFPSGSPGLSPDVFRASLMQAVQEGYTIVLDLPPVTQVSGQPTPSMVAAGAVCDVVFLVSLSGRVTQKELAACVESSRVIGLKLGGMILNDWRMPVSGLIES